MNMISEEIKDIEIELLIEAIFRRYGYDFRNYSRASIKRRIMHRFSMEGFSSISQMQHRVLSDVSFLETIIRDLSINTTDMFRDPSFYKALRTDVVPLLKTYPFIKIWHAGCSSGEEVYSTAILLKEEDLYDRAIIYATDFNEDILKRAKQAIYPINLMKQFSSNYHHSGGKEEFSKYYITNQKSAMLDKSLKKNIVFADHNLVTDRVFGEMNMIICRNVLIYFNRKLQNHVIRLFRDSLVRKGILCLGSKETVSFSEHADDFEKLVAKEKIYVKHD